MIRRVAALWLSLTMVIGFVVIVDVTIDFAPSVSGTTLYVNTTGTGGAYPKIQYAIENASAGFTVFVFSGTYYENVIVNKRINLTGEEINTTIIDGSESGDVVNITADWINITGFTITRGGTAEGDAGIQINSENSSIFSNNISSNGCYGIYVCKDGNDIYTNNISDNYRGITIDHCNFNNIKNNYFSSGLFLINIVYSNRNVVSENDAKVGSISLDYSNENNITGNIGHISLVDSCENNVINNNGSIGLISNSMRNNVIANNFSNRTYGISFHSSDQNNIINNNISSNTKNGIDIYFSSENNFINNTICSNGEYGIYMDSAWKNRSRIIGNQISFNQLWGIHMASSSNNIFGNNISNNENGINAFLCSDNNITNNNISDNNGTAIRFSESSENNITQNLISNNRDGIRIIGIPPFSNSIDNKIYHNTFINNTNQSYDENYENYWDNGYPHGGNYWSDYIGDDSFKGPGQNIPGSDGIGDTPYVIDSDSQDNYPLMELYKSLENYTILKQGWNLISIPLIQEETNLTRVLGSIDSWYDTVERYNISDASNRWKHYSVGKPFGNDLFEINEIMGFWIYINQPGDTIFLYNGTQPTENQTINLHPGWNLVGYPSQTSYNRTQGLNNLTFGTHVESIWTFDAVTQKWELLNESDYFKPGRGYWINAKVECEWEVPL